MAETEEYSFHRFSQVRHDIGIWAEIRPVPQPVSAHRHDFYEIAFALAGDGHHEDEDGRLPILLGDVWIVRPGQWHAFPLVGRRLRVCNLLLSREFCHASSAILRTTASHFFTAPVDDTERDRLATMAVRHIRLSAQGLERIQPLLIALAAESTAAPTPGQASLCAGLVLQVLGTLDRYATSNATQSAAGIAAHDDAGILAVVRYIEEHYAEALTLADLARQSSYATTYLVHKFHKRLGITPIEYLLQVRLQHACALLETTDLPVQAVAYKVGFADSRYFATRFRRVLGITPTRFRERMRDGMAKTLLYPPPPPE